MIAPRGTVLNLKKNIVNKKYHVVQHLKCTYLYPNWLIDNLKTIYLIFKLDHKYCLFIHNLTGQRTTL